jgi:hypothetical protein
MSSATEPRRRPFAAPAARTLRAVLLAVVLPALAGAAAVPAPPSPPRADAAALREALDRGEKMIDKAREALKGKDPGRVSALLLRADEQIALFQASSGLEDLVKDLEAARAAAGAGDGDAAEAALKRAREILFGLSDYVVARQAEESGRGALIAAQRGDAAGCLEALARFEDAILAPILLARVREARQAIARTRTDMVRRDMATGAKDAETARRSLDRLRYGGALSRALFGLRTGSELLQGGAGITARDQVQKALVALRTASTYAPDARRADLEKARAEAAEVWKHMTRTRDGDADRLAAVARTVEEIRRQQD